MARERILIVEDEGIVAADLQSMVSQLGYEVAGIASTGAEAVEKTDALKPDLVLMDIRLQGTMDGIDAAERIVGEGDIPVVYLTAYADPSTVDRAKTTLPYGYILKPFEERDLRTALELALYKHRMISMMQTLEHWHASTLRSLAEAVLTTDGQGRLTFLNERAESLTGHTLADVYGRPFSEIVLVRDASSTRPAPLPFEKVLRDGAKIHSEDPVLLSSREGREIPVYYSCGPIKNEEGAISGAAVILTEMPSPAQSAPRPHPPRR